MAFAFHEGELTVQRRAGGSEVAARVGRNIAPEIPPAAGEFLEEQPLVVAGARTPDGAVWASLLTGAPGFARAPDERTVVLAARPRAGDPLREALGVPDAPIGLLAIDPATRRRMRVNGTATVDRHGIVVRTAEVYSNCPKYIARRVVTDVEPDGGPPRAARFGTSLTGAQLEIVGAADTFFIATAHRRAGADVSHRGGTPGFVFVDDERHLSFPDYVGNNMYMTLGNLESDPHAGLLLVDWEAGDVLMLSGTARVDWSPERAATVPGAQRMIDFAIDQVVDLPGASPLRWRLLDRSRFNPVAVS